MTRKAVALDRVASLLVGAALIAIGLGALVWNTDLISGTPEAVAAPGLATATGQPWWGWVLAGAGVALVLSGLLWLLAHSPARRATALSLDGTSGEGRLSADLGAVAEGAADSLNAVTGLSSAKGRAIVDRGLVTIDLDVTIGADRDLGAVAAAIDHVCAQLPRMIGDPGVAARTRIHVSAHAAGADRVQ